MIELTAVGVTLLLLLVLVREHLLLLRLLLLDHESCHDLLIVQVVLDLVLDCLLLLRGQQANGGHVAAQHTEGGGALGGPVEVILATQGGVPVVLDSILCAASERLGNL